MSGSLQDVLKEYVIKLGYAEDQSSRRRFVDSVQYMGVAVGKLALSVEAAAASVIAAVAKIADSMESLHYVADATKSTGAAIQDLSFKMSQFGGSANEVRGMVQRLAEQVRDNPGFQKYVEHFTHAPYKDAVSGFEQISEAFRKMQAAGTGLPQLLAQWKSLGFSEQDFLVAQRTWKMSADGIHTVGQVAEQSVRRMRQAIVGSDPDYTKLLDNMVAFNNQKRLLEATGETFWEKIAGDLGPGLTKDMQDLQKELEHDAPYIVKQIESISRVLLDMGKFVTGAAIGMLRFVHDMADQYEKASPATQHFAKAVGEIVLAFLAFNRISKLSPAGVILTLVGAIAVLYGDYAKWKDSGGRDVGLVDWSKWQPAIDAVLKAIPDIVKNLEWLLDKLGGVQTVVEALTALLIVKFAVTSVAAVASAATSIGASFAAMGRSALSLISILGTVGAVLIAALVWREALRTGNISDQQEKDLIAQANIAHGEGFRNKLPPKAVPNGAPGASSLERGRQYESMSWLHRLMGNPDATTYGDFDTGFNMRAMSNFARTGSQFMGQFGGGGGARSMDSPRVKEAMETLKGLGYSAVAAAGIVGNLYQESRLNPGARNASGHYGVAQWDQQRQLSFYAWAGHSMEGSNLGEQLRFLDYELKNSASERKAAGMIDAATTPGQAAFGMLQSERPAGYQNMMGTESVTRAGYANQAYNIDQGLSVPPGSGASGPRAVTVVQHNNLTFHNQTDPAKTADLVQRAMDARRQDAWRNVASTPQ